nr:hypothetical protein [Tanacetum cinerariifolium]
MVLGECLEIRDNHLCSIWKNMRNNERSRPAGFQLAGENLQSGVKEEDSIIDVENTFEDQSLHVLRPSRLCAQAQSRDDTLFHKRAYMEYTQLVFCKLFGMRRERHLACSTRMHGSLLLSFQGYVLSHGLTPPPNHLFGGDTGLLNDQSLHVLRPSRLCAQAQSRDDTLSINELIWSTPNWCFNSMVPEECLKIRDYHLWLCAQAQLGDDTLFHKQAYMEYTQLVFCKLFGMSRERHQACPTRMHDSLILSFQGYILNYNLILPHDHLFRGDTGLLN